MEVGREVEKAMKRIAEATERNAKASEALIDLAKEERDVGSDILAPGFCPHCSTVNPIVRSEGGAGRINDFVLVSACQECGGIIWAVPNGFTVFSSREAAEELVTERNQNVSVA